MKFMALFLLMTMITNTYAQDPAATLKNFDAKVYSLKTKGVQDFVVDIESSKLTKQMNEQQIFGKIKELIFRTYWTANPERLAIEVIGMPEGFKEVKEELKMNILKHIENLLPPQTSQKLSGYKFKIGANASEIIAQDSTGIAAIPSFSFKFDQDKLVGITGHKPVGSLAITPTYSKESFADGKWVLKKTKTEMIENGQTLQIEKSLSYGQVQGVTVLKEIEIETDQKFADPNMKPVSYSEEVTFSNYKINAGDALKYFLVEFPKETPKP